METIEDIVAVKHQFREVTKTIPREEVDVAENATTTPTCDKSSQVGDRMLDLLNRVHDFLGKLCRDGRCDDHCSECIDASDLADNVWDLIQSCKEPSQAGNVAAMREAMELMLEWYYELHDDVAAMDAAMEKVRAALSAPPRNCDIGTAEEQNVRMLEFCREQWKKTDGRALCSGCRFHYIDGLDCQFAWSQMPYEEGKKK